MPPAPAGRGLRELLHDPLKFFLSVTAQYGDIVLYRPAPDPAYLINHPDYVRHVLVDNNRNYTKSTSSNEVFKKVVGDGLLTSEGAAWRKQRRMMQPAFHHTRLKVLDGMIVRATQSMLERWQGFHRDHQPVDIAREMAALTLTITTRSLFGLIYLIGFGSLVGFTSYVWLLRNAPVSLVSTYAYVNPVVAIFLGALLAGELINLPIILSALVIIASVVVINMSKKAQPHEKPETAASVAD